jgi:hypothetical protein
MEPLTLIAGIGKLLGSNVAGSALGWVGGWLQRKQDIEVRKLELLDAEKARAHEVALRRVDIEIMHAEIAGRERIASIETEGKVEAAQFDAIAAGYATQFAGEGWVSAFSKAIRPFVTLWFVVASSALTIAVIVLAMRSGVEFSPQDWREWLGYVLAWTMFQAGVCIGWWFAVRNSQVPQLRR